jgi:hypothetical protein
MAGKQIGSPQTFDRARKQALNKLLPDRAEIIPPDRRVKSPSGGYEEIPSDPILYKGLPFVPCRLDISKHYRSDDIFGQEAIVNDFEIHVPFDALILADYKIVIINHDDPTRREYYEVRKLLDTNSWAITRVALVNRVDIGVRAK